MPWDAIRRKRDGETLPADLVRDFFQAYLEERVDDYQMSAFLMAVYFRGLDDGELAVLVDVMMHSGIVTDLSDLPGRKVDKHSTGGVGDKVSIVLAPLVASLGVTVPMISGRGLGHTGGTADKLESIPGFRTDLTPARWRAQLERIGCALFTQTAAVAPLDRRLYALRDVTATVESIPLIAASIMSKKLATGIDGLVLDVKVGNGAFLPGRAQAEELARTMIAIGRAGGRSTVAWLTAMDRPLGHAVGNAIEVMECIATLRGEGPADLVDVTLALAAEMLVLGDHATDLDAGRAQATAALEDGRALETLRTIIEAQDGDPTVLDEPERLPLAPVVRVVESAVAGTVSGIDARAIGHAAVALGAGRRRMDDGIDPRVGFHIAVKPADSVAGGDAIATVYAADEAGAEVAAASIEAAIRIDEGPADPLPLLIARIDGA